MVKICYEKAAWLFKGTEQKMVEKDSEEYTTLIKEGWVSGRTEAAEPTEAEKPKSSKRGRKNEK